MPQALVLGILPHSHSRIRKCKSHTFLDIRAFILLGFKRYGMNLNYKARSAHVGFFSEGNTFTFPDR